jgi:capsular exopolysaccharide synthesis family protein
MKSVVKHEEALPAEGPAWEGRGGAAASLRDLRQIMRHHRLIIAACVVGAVAAALLLVNGLTPVYQATASLRIDQRPATQQPAIDVLWSTPENSIGTEVEILQSRALAATVSDSLGLRLQITSPEALRRDSVFSRVVVAPDADSGYYLLGRDPGGPLRVRDRMSGAVLATVPANGRVAVRGFQVDLTPTALRMASPVEFSILTRQQAAGAITAALTVAQRGREADIVDVTYGGTDPRQVSDVANGLVSQYISERKQNRQSSARSTAKFVREQITKVAERLAGAEDSLQRYRERAGIVSIDDEASTEVRRKAELLGQRNALESERIALDRLLADARRSPAAESTGKSTSYRDLVAFPSLLRNQAVGALLQSLAQVEDRRSELRLRRRPEDPDVQVLTDRGSELEGQIRGMALGYRQGLSNQVAAIDGIIASSSRSMEAIPAKQIRLAQLKREVTLLEQVYEQLQSRLKEAEIAEAAEDDASVALVDAAVLPSKPVRPLRLPTAAIAVVAAMLGTAAGLGISVARELTNVTVRTRGDAETVLGLPVLGVVPRIDRRRLLAGVTGAQARRRRGRTLVPRRTAADQSASKLQGAMFADVYDRLHTSLLHARSPERLRTIVFTSPLSKEGKTTSAANLALALARHGMRIVLVDADLRRGQVSSMLGARPGPGLSEVLTTAVPLSSAIRRVEFEGAAQLDYLTAGVRPEDPLNLLGSDRLDAVLGELGARYDRVIIDTPPLNIVMDALVLGAKADAVVLVARVGATPVDALAFAGEQARNAGVTITGVLLNDVDLSRYGGSDTAYRWYGYGAEYYAAAVNES